MEIDTAGLRSTQELLGTTQTRNADEELGRTAFLELMIAQISNQDPLEPAKNEAFIAQLAQFSSVEGIQNLNESMDSLVASLRSSMTMDAAGLVGRNVLIPTNQTVLNTQGGIGGVVGVDTTVNNMTVEIANSAGQVVHRANYGAMSRGEFRFDWNGLTEEGIPVEQDFFQVRAYGDLDGELQAFEVQLPDQIVSVSITDGGLVANLAGGTSVSASQIREIRRN